MSKKLFIPKKCRVGFQHREDTFTNKLAYIIYYDSFDKLRKEKSWTTWCHLPGNSGTRWHRKTGKDVPIEGIEPFDFDNTPQSGFVLNKGIQRYNWSHFGSDRSYIRIYDPRGIEFEITPENLIGLLMHTDCSKREIQGDLVYCWHGQNLMLLPCASEEYEAAKNFTALQATKIGARELIEGHTYVTKKVEELIYVGRHPWYEVKHDYEHNSKRTFTKQHIFYVIDREKDYIAAYKPIKSIPTTISAVLDPNPNDQTANLIDGYLASEQSSPIVGWKEVQLHEDFWDPKKFDDFRHSRIVHIKDKGYHGVCIEKYARHHSRQRRSSFFDEHHRQGNPSRFDQATIISDPPALSYRINNNVCSDGTVKYCHHEFNYCPVTPENQSMFFELHAVFENGLEKKWS